MKEQQYDDLLNIVTVGEQAGFNKSYHYHRYEPTPYSALQHLFSHYTLKSSDHIVDFGCGKGRLNFFIHHLFKATVTGVEMNEVFYELAMDNRESYCRKMRGSEEQFAFQCCLAEEYEIKSQDNVFYFFNPFSVQIFMKIVSHILLSCEQHPRDVELVFYYISDEYMYYLEHQTPFELVQEIELTDAYPKNPNERFMIYKLSY
ncbi:methyltransferase [Bacillus sp. AGMB 02131]|uniref:Methyltransferase n=1 Tax=Peribacillus faecalis TaxID=2772559 RepID=A0A927H9X2_9BACI|nr:methyltransferase [Peribacillus faecalis]MBD3108035.1 methyltransferase [Peribacillus faecalis]